MRFEATYGENGNYNEVMNKLRAELKPYTPNFMNGKALVDACQKNPWLKTGGIDFEDDPDMEKEYGFDFVYTTDIEILEMYFDHGNWSIRNGIVFETLAFVNQVNGGDEWATFKLVGGGRWEQFESHTFAPMIESGRFKNYIMRLERRRVKKEDYFWKE